MSEADDLLASLEVEPVLETILGRELDHPLAIVANGGLRNGAGRATGGRRYDVAGVGAGEPGVGEAVRVETPFDPVARCGGAAVLVDAERCRRSGCRRRGRCRDGRGGRSKLGSRRMRGS